MTEDAKPRAIRRARSKPKVPTEAITTTQTKSETAPKREENKTLVVFTTKQGASGDAANLIAETLRQQNSLEVDVVDLKKQPHPDVSGYKNVVVGGGVRGGEVYKQTKDFMNQDFGGKRVAVFVCSSGAKNTESAKRLVERFITQGLANNTNLNVVGSEAFGGCIRILGKAIQDNRDPARIRAWAEELGKKFTQ